MPSSSEAPGAAPAAPGGPRSAGTAEAAAHAHLRAAETLEALHAIGDRRTDAPLPGGVGGEAGEGDARGPVVANGHLAAACEQYERAIALHPGMVEAYDGLGRLTLGLSRLSCALGSLM